jgi:phosphotransferase system HPr-like phosphotransfer protein
MPARTLRIGNMKGLHARASAKLVEVVERTTPRPPCRATG